MPTPVPAHKWKIYFAARDRGLTQAAASREAGISPATAERMESGKITSQNREARRVWLESAACPVIPLHKLRAEPKKALQDFGYFRKRYFGRISSPWQEDAGYRLVELMATADREYVVVNMPPGAGKDLALDTPLVTPTGWSTIKDVQVGDQVIGADGCPTTVLAKSEVFYDHDCYQVSSDDGASVIAGAGHLWTVRLHGHGTYGHTNIADYPGKTGPKASPDGLRTHTTAFLAQSRSKRPQLQITAPLDLPGQDLPIDPYTLGVWLGDGTSAGATFTCHPDDAPHIVARIQQAGHAVEHKGKMRYSITGSARWARDGLRTNLRLLGLLNNKHVPDIYLRASVPQRLALLQGLIDTDGSVSPTGHVEFCNTNERLALAVQYLVRSLGVKAALTEGIAKLYGKDCGPRYRVTFYLADAASLPRKAERCRGGVRTTARYLTVTPVETVPTQCIQVAAKDGLFLAGDGLLVTHNSTVMTHDVIAWLLCRDRALRILIGSATQSLARSYVSRLRNTFDRISPPMASMDLVEAGLAVDASSTLLQDFGKFKPAHSQRWRDDEFVIAQHNDDTSTDKESSVTAYGRDSGVLGGRFDLCVWDDLVDRKTLRSADARAKLEEDYDNELETRLEPRGLFVLQGQRLGPGDLYRYCISADALTITERGEIPLREVVVGDQVLTREGYQKVLYSGSQGIKQTVVVTTMGGRSLTLTGDHQIAVPGGWARADSLVDGDLLVVGQSESLTPFVGLSAADVAAGATHSGVAAQAGVLGRELVPMGAVSACCETPDTSRPQHIAPGIFTDEMFQSDTRRVAAQVARLQPLRDRATVEGELAQHHAGHELLARESRDSRLRVALRTDTFGPEAALPHPFGTGSEPLLGDLGDPRVNPVARDTAGAGDLHEGLTVDTVHSLVRHGPTIETWDLTVEDTPEFYANGILVHNCLDKKGAPPTDEDGFDLDIGDLPPKYHHIVYPAHDEAKCTGKHPLTLPAWPKSCLLEPIRLDWKLLRRVQAANDGKYRTVYQQEDLDPASMLVHPIWVKGGTDPVSGEKFQGCWDDTRAMGQWPQHLAGKVQSIACVDPSGERYWGATHWASQESTDTDHLVQLSRSHMMAGQLLDQLQDGTYVGLMEDWQQNSRQMGHPITHWIVEINAAQRYLLQYRHVMEWQRSRQVLIIPHATHRNRNDPDRGVETLGNLYKYGQVRLPCKDADSRLSSHKLVTEATMYPQGPSTDLLMSQWFLRFNLPNLRRKNTNIPAAPRPEWLSGGVHLAQPKHLYAVGQ